MKWQHPLKLAAWLILLTAAQSLPAATFVVVPADNDRSPGTARQPPAALPSATGADPQGGPEPRRIDAAAGEMLFHDGRTEWKICVAAQPDPTELFAAEELRDTLGRISGASFEIVRTDDPPDRLAIVVGSLDNPQVQARSAQLRLSPGKTEQVAVATLDGRLYLVGNQPRAALYAVYHFLQNQLGVRWLWPGPDGEFLPRKTSWPLPELDLHHQPAFVYRGFHLCGDWRDVEIFRQWMARNFINVHRHAAPPEDKRRGFYSMWSSHNVVLSEALFDEHPEYFAEIDGKRYKSNVCLSHPEVDRLVAAQMADYLRRRPFLDLLSVFPSDNQDYCRCAACSTRDVSTSWFEFYNRLTDTLKAEFPRLKFATIAYQGYRDVPKCPIRNSEFVEYASYSRCNVHPYGEVGCRHNDDTLRDMLAWQATGLAIGHYAYEYDVYSKNCRFVPMLSVIEDAVRTSRRLGHVSVIPEVSLSPKEGPDLYAHHVQNRLSIYLYARLLWDPDQPMNRVLDDWCRTAFGEAAEPMLAYYMAMDRAWTAMPIHATILGNALNAAPHLMSDRLRAEAAAQLAAAQQRLAMIEDPAARERAAAALRHEQALFLQWLDLYRATTAQPRATLPYLARPDDFPHSACRALELAAGADQASKSSTQVRLAWTGESLLVHWACRGASINNPQGAESARDGNVAGDDRVELAISSGLAGETWHFAVNSQGVRESNRDSSVGVHEDRWNPPWQADVALSGDAWEAQMTIPFASLGQAPNPGETWEARFVRRICGRQNTDSAALPPEGNALLLFSAAARTDRTLFWWSGAPDRDGQRTSAIVQEFTEAGWQMDVASSDEALRKLADRFDAYWFRHPDGPSKVPADYWQKHLVPAVRDGAVAVFISYWNIPLADYFDDPSLKVAVVQCGKIPLAERVTASIAPGDWSSKPNDLVRGLRSQITPAYGFVPADGAGWTVLATAPGGNGTTYPYLLARPYGRGLIVVGGDDIRLSPAKMLENFVLDRRQTTEEPPSPP
ncbi:MAG: DUF4838 domain-containing protein [Thermoguttaceae bacterium]